MTLSGLIGSGLPGRLQVLVAVAEDLDEIIQRDVQLAGLGQQGVDAFGDEADSFTASQRRAGIGDIGSGGTPLGNEAGSLQLTISAGDGVGRNQELLRER